MANLPSIGGTVKSPSQKVTPTLTDVSEFVIHDGCTIGERVFTCYVSPTGLQGSPLLFSLPKLKHHLGFLRIEALLLLFLCHPRAKWFLPPTAQ
jgi:hypothetical protein